MAQLVKLPIRSIARRLGLTDRWIGQFAIRMPDGSLFVPPRVRWCVLIKAIVEQFCPGFAPRGIVFYIGGTDNKSAHLGTAEFFALGVKWDSATILPDVIVRHPTKNRLILIEAVTSAGPLDGKRRKELKKLFAGCKVDLVFITVFETRQAMQLFLLQIPRETGVWIADEPEHMIQLNGKRLLGPWREVGPT